LLPTQVLWECLQMCWSPEVFLLPLSDKFLKLSLQLLSRYLSWVERCIETDTNSGATNTLWWVHMFCDVEILGAEVRKVLTDTACSILNAAAQTALVAVTASLHGMCSLLELVLKSVASMITKGTIRKCTDSLQPLRGISATYRMTNKAVPTQHSFYVENVITPVDDFLRESEPLHIVHAHKAAWTWTIVNAVLEKSVVCCLQSQICC